jgi:hypothetical protein
MMADNPMRPAPIAEYKGQEAASKKRPSRQPASWSIE